MPNPPPPKPNQEPIILEYVEKPTEFVSNTIDFVLKPISASEAFRKYSWLKDLMGSEQAVGLNKSGNLRGMVINPHMRMVYDLSEKYGKRLQVLAILIEVAKEMSRIRKVYNSDDSAAEKTSHILLLGGAAILRSVTGIVPIAWHLVSLSAEGYAGLYDVVTGSNSGAQFAARIDRLDQQVTSTHKRQWDGENWYNLISVKAH